MGLSRAASLFAVFVCVGGKLSLEIFRAEKKRRCIASRIVEGLVVGSVCVLCVCVYCVWLAKVL